MKTIMYIHGYGSTGNAVKAQHLQAMFPDARLLSPTWDYDGLPPQEIFHGLQRIIAEEKPDMIMGSSMGGYYALCCTQCYDGPVWCINPVRDIIATLRRLHPEAADKVLFEQRCEEYALFDRQVFQQIKPRDGQLHFALSTDDELLGDHSPLLAMFPNYGSVVWKERCGHRFYRFDELKGEIEALL